MDVENVLEYLGECLSCESRILSLIKMKEKIKEIQNKEYEENKEYEDILKGKILNYSSLRIPEYDLLTIPESLKYLHKEIEEDFKNYYKDTDVYNKNFVLYGWNIGFKKLVKHQIKFLNEDNCLIQNNFDNVLLDYKINEVKVFFHLEDPCKHVHGFRKRLDSLNGSQVCYEMLNKNRNKINKYVKEVSNIYHQYSQDNFEKEYYKYSISKPILNNKIKQLDDEIVKTKEILNGLYGLNIIHAKYQDIIAVSSFIDYLSSGRCNGFEGADGCYNLFESESRQDKIINQLTEITSLLKDIKQQQYALYCVLNEINTRVENISRDFIDFKNSYRNHSDEIINSLESIKKSNTAIAFETSLSNRLLEISNENQNAIIQNQKFEQLLYTEPSIFGARQITAKALSKYR